MGMGMLMVAGLNPGRQACCRQPPCDNLPPQHVHVQRQGTAQSIVRHSQQPRSSRGDHAPLPPPHSPSLEASLACHPSFARASPEDETHRRAVGGIKVGYRGHIPNSRNHVGSAVAGGMPLQLFQPPGFMPALPTRSETELSRAAFVRAPYIAQTDATLRQYQLHGTNRFACVQAKPPARVHGYHRPPSTIHDATPNPPSTAHHAPPTIQQPPLTIHHAPTSTTIAIYHHLPRAAVCTHRTRGAISLLLASRAGAGRLVSMRTSHAHARASGRGLAAIIWRCPRNRLGLQHSRTSTAGGAATATGQRARRRISVRCSIAAGRLVAGRTIASAACRPRAEGP
mgnify:CR=1 FL=1